MSERYLANLNDVVIDFETLEDGFEKAIVRHEMPYKDGPLLEDMGEKARVIRIRCYFIGERYPDHIELINDLKSRTKSEFVHPEYGLIEGATESIVVRQNERLETAEIDITFVEEGRDVTALGVVDDVQEAVEDNYIEGQDGLKTWVSQDIVKKLGTEGYSILGVNLDPNKGLLGQFNGLSLAARNYLKGVDTYVGGLKATLNQIANPANGLIASISYGTQLPGIVIGAIAQTLERYSILYYSLRSAPTRFLSNMKYATIDLMNKFPGQSSYTRSAGAHRLGIEAASLYKTDDVSRRNNQRLSAKSFDAQGNYLKPDPAEPVMTLDELEGSLALVRSFMQDSIDEARAASTGQRSLNEMAVSLLRHVSEVKLQRDKIIVVEVPLEMPLHLICLKHDLPYSYADRLLLINKIKHPSYIPEGEISIYAR